MKKKVIVKKILGIVVTIMFLAAPAYAVVETGAVGAPAKTLADFERSYSDTKPIVAWNKYQEYRRLQNAPRPTLSVSRMRTWETFEGGLSGTKPIVRATRKHVAVNTGISVLPTAGSGTKPIVGYRRKA